MEAQAIYKHFERLIKYRRWIAGCLAGGLALNKGLSHMFPQNLFLPFHAELEIDNFSFSDMIAMVRTSMEDVGQMEPVHPFITDHSACVAAGFSGLKQFTQVPTIGIPKQYFCNNVFDVEDLKIKLNNSGRIIDSQGGPNEWKFLESLLFSEASKKFDIARCLFIFKENWFIGTVLIPPLFVFLGYCACFPAYRWFNKGKRVSPGHLLKWQVSCIFATWLLCTVVQKFYKYTMLKSVDQKASSLSQEYAQGAVDYCKNIRKTNKALRVLLGKRGEKMFTPEGDYASPFGLFWRRYEQTLNTRQNRFEDNLKTIQLFNNTRDV